MKTKIVNSLIAACLIGTASTAFAANISVNSRDKHFVRNFSRVSLEVARIGQLAQTRSRDAQVKELGQNLVQVYTQAGQQVANAAQGVDINSRSKLRGSAAREVNKLADLSGVAFDQAALHELYKCEETGVRQLDMEADSNGSGNAALRQSALKVQAVIEPVVWQTAQLNAQFNGLPGHR
jgi:predicted outer membrane protein